MEFWRDRWNSFKNDLPHQNPPFSSRNWGNNLHSICSFQGKLKPSIAHFLVSIFVPKKGKFLDPFAGVGTIPFEGALQGKNSFALEYNESAFYICKAKLESNSVKNVGVIIDELNNYIKKNTVTSDELREAREFGFNGKIIDYYHEKTLNEILLARRFFLSRENMNASESFVMACLLHILHGNRPYALSRKSHPLTPYKPSGEFVYKSLIEKLIQKTNRSMKVKIPYAFHRGSVYRLDSTKWWPPEIDNLDAVITSPPFFDSTRFYMSNWLRTWFAGWSTYDFKIKKLNYVDNRQKIEGFSVYVDIIRQARERLNKNGVLIFHLGKSDKCDMAENILKYGEKWFSNSEIYTENVEHTEKHGVRDKGRVKAHTYLLFH